MTTVLVVDDSLIDRKLAGAIIEAEGATPIYAENGKQALELLSAQKPDAVLTDLQMPEMDGLTLVRQIKEHAPATPVILMTGKGSEEIAADALHAGAASYVPKRNLRRDLNSALSIVLTATESARQQQQVLGLLQRSENHYVLGFEPSSAGSLVNHLLDWLDKLQLCDKLDRLRVGTALGEALINAIEHGNLELSSELRQTDDDAYRRLVAQRAGEEPYRDRRVYVTARLTPDAATYVIRDEGPGFDPSCLPDPTDPENLSKPSGRGVMLIRTFMDDVCYNQAGNEVSMTKRRTTPPAAERLA